MQKLNNFLEKYRVFVVLGAIFVCLLVFWQTYNFINRPRDLGPEIQYIGSVDTGCGWIPSLLLLGLCASPVSQISHFFATDLTESELREYFTKVSGSKVKHASNGVVYAIEFTGNDNNFSATYRNEDALRRDYALELPDKRFFLSITPESYKLARKAL